MESLQSLTDAWCVIYKQNSNTKIQNKALFSLVKGGSFTVAAAMKIGNREALVKFSIWRGKHNCPRNI